MKKLPPPATTVIALWIGLATNSAYPAQVTCADILAPNDSVTGIRQDSGATNPVVITGSYQPSCGGLPRALLYKGPLVPTDPSGYIFLTPTFAGQTVTTSIFYRPNTSLFDPSLGAGNIRAVGSYKYSEGGSGDHSMMYTGALDGSGTWTQINVPNSVAGGPVFNTIAHSTMGNLVVGNYDISGSPGSANAFIYNIKNNSYKKLNIGRLATAYGICRTAAAAAIPTRSQAVTTIPAAGSIGGFC